MVVALPAGGRLAAAWVKVHAIADAPTISLGRPRVAIVPADPVDGPWVTAVARVNDGVLDHEGFATDRSPSPDLLRRAVAEAAERAAWSAFTSGAEPGSGPGARPAVVVRLRHYQRSARRLEVRLDSRAVPNEGTLRDHSTVGSAIHTTPAAAIRAAAGELGERAAFLRLFHRRSLGESVPVSSGLAPLASKVAVWRHDASGLVAAAVFSPDLPPFLSMGAHVLVGSRIRQSVRRSVAEAIQPRAWARWLEANHRPWSRRGVVDPATRALYWSTIDPAQAERVWVELRRHSGVDVSWYPRVEKLTLWRTALVKLSGVHRPLYFAQVHDVSEVYALHSARKERDYAASIKSDFEFVPHPLI